jgi:hypothetical protein
MTMEERKARMTSFELEEEHYNYINQLITEGKIRSLKEFVEMCVEFGRKNNINEWHPGIFNVGPVRVVLIPKKMLDVFVQHLPEESYEPVGREIGELIRSYALLKYQIDTTKPENWKKALEVISDTGLGHFIINDNNVEIISPCLPIGITQQIIQTVLGVPLETVKMLFDVHFFKIKQSSAS